MSLLPTALRAAHIGRSKSLADGHVHVLLCRLGGVSTDVDTFKTHIADGVVASGLRLSNHAKQRLAAGALEKTRKRLRLASDHVLQDENPALETIACDNGLSAYNCRRSPLTSVMT